MGLESVLLLVPSVAMGITAVVAVVAGYVVISCSFARFQGSHCK
jgi:hypothetical protein